MEEYLFVDEKQNIFTGETAKDKLQNTSDKKYLVDKKGVVQVPDERWKLAQSYEKHYWMQHAQQANDDRNIDHYYEFDEYKCLRKKHFKTAIELGCGPFTNLRLIASVAKIDECTLEDPLIDSYLSHPNCKYLNKKYLEIEYVKKDPIVIRAIRKLIRYFSKPLASKIKLKRNNRLLINGLINLPIEEMTPTKKYDLIVLINVIEHCKDIEKIFELIQRLSTPDTIFVFSDKYYYYNKIADNINGHCFEAGHPLLVDKTIIESFLHKYFIPLFEKIIRKEHNVGGFDWSYESVYYIGKFKNN